MAEVHTGLTHFLRDALRNGLVRNTPNSFRNKTRITGPLAARATFGRNAAPGTHTADIAHLTRTPHSLILYRGRRLQDPALPGHVPLELGAWLGRRPRNEVRCSLRTTCRTCTSKPTSNPPGCQLAEQPAYREDGPFVSASSHALDPPHPLYDNQARLACRSLRLSNLPCWALI